MIKKGLEKFGKAVYIAADKTPDMVLAVVASVSMSMLYAKGLSNAVKQLEEQGVTINVE